MCADKMVMRSVIGFHAEQAVMHADFAEDAAVEESPNVLVHRAERDRGNLPAHLFEYCFGTGMTIEGHDRLEDDLALVRSSQTVAMADFAKFLGAKHS